MFNPRGEAAIVQPLDTDPSIDDYPPLNTAAANNRPDLLEQLLEAGEPIDGSDPDYDSPLVEASMTGALEAVRFLVDRGANLHLGKPLEAAAEAGHREVVEYLGPLYPKAVQERAQEKLAQVERWRRSPSGKASSSFHLATASSFLSL